MAPWGFSEHRAVSDCVTMSSHDTHTIFKTILYRALWLFWETLQIRVSASVNCVVDLLDVHFESSMYKTPTDFSCVAIFHEMI